MPLSKKKEDTLRAVLSSLLKVDDSAVTRVMIFVENIMMMTESRVTPVRDFRFRTGDLGESLTRLA